MSDTSKAQVMNAVRTCLTRQGRRFTQDDAGFHFSSDINSPISPVLTKILCRDGSLICYTALCTNVPRDRRMAVMKYITCANYGLRLGNFEMDQRDGEVRYKCFLGCSDRIPDSLVLKKALNIGFAMFERYGDGLLDVICNDADPIKACQRAEN